MFEEELDLTKFRTTLKKVIQNLEEIENVSIKDLKEEVENAFGTYHYDGIDEIKFCEKWECIDSDGEYVLNVGIDHENAYEFSVYIKVTNNKASITNVL
ncbi:hypothetical protein [Arcobacter sp. FWKO B]|uniref:hypothetical protein n=1 Tax=Arcobacter sp. FWKO B TaxID=2593672 RepID=UPI0018A5FE4B|nr:hypothetical protein [Arcobacter sp. FWKO B]QOG12458.1 hypothetical protein FWKOB_06975 [Arcobacter sp. FWKO B]